MTTKAKTIAESRKKSDNSRKQGIDKVLKATAQRRKMKSELRTRIRTTIKKAKEELKTIKEGQNVSNRVRRFADIFARGELDLTKPEQQKLIQKIVNTDILERYNMTPKRTLQEYFFIAASNIADYVDWDKDGKMYLKSKEDLTREQTAAIREINTRRDSATGQYYVIKLKFHDKIEALRDIAKHYGLFEKDNIQKSPHLDVEAVINALPPELTDLVRTQLAKKLNSYGTNDEDGMGLRPEELN
jgi:hypothetical protein